MRVKLVAWQWSTVLWSFREESWKACDGCFLYSGSGYNGINDPQPYRLRVYCAQIT